MPAPYSVIFATYTERYYLKDVKKKYSKRVQKNMEEAIEGIMRNPEEAISRKIIKTITDQDEMIIGKFDIAIPGQNIGTRSGWRGIVALNNEKKTARVLLVYSKDHVKGTHETAWWQSVIKDRYPELADLLS
jgi:ABC-type proline/glycine betaine transport system substrate-binding protein